jgi:flagellar basal body-associated protein FliL
MKTEDPSPKDNQQKSSGSSEDQQKKAKKGLCLLDKLIVAIVAVTIGYVGITFINCNFMVPGSMERANALGGLKNPPPLECEQSTSQGYNALFMLLTAILGLKAKVED